MPHNRVLSPIDWCTGRWRLTQIEDELKKLLKIENKNVIRTYAAHLTVSESSDPSRLAILREQKPALTLHDILTDCDTLREDRVSVSVQYMLEPAENSTLFVLKDYFAQILGGLNAIHANHLFHRGEQTFRFYASKLMRE